MSARERPSSGRKEPPGDLPAREEAAALLLVHGIGEQEPYQTMDAFARGLAGRLGLGRGAMEHRLVHGDGYARTVLRLRLPRPLGPSGATVLDLHEFYWAGLVQGRIRLREVLAWVARTSVTPLRAWSRQPALLFREAGAAGRPWGVFLRELLRAGALLGVAAAVVLPFVYAAGHGATVVRAARGLTVLFGGVERPVALVCWAALVLFALLIFRGWAQMAVRRIRGPGPAGPSSIERAASRWWLRASVLAFAALAGAAAWVHASFELGAPALLAGAWASVRSLPVLLPLASVGIALAVRRPLVGFVGDIALYTTADERSSFFRTRQDILARSTSLLRGLLRDPAYGAVYVAGHSLGSVIAWDTLNRLVREVRADAAPAATPVAGPTTVAAPTPASAAAPVPAAAPGSGVERPAGAARVGGAGSDADAPLRRTEWDRLGGLLTFGSPLDKVHYFFRRRVREREAVRAQLLSSLHGFRRRASGREYGELTLAPYEIPEPRAFRWWNVHAPLDPVSGRLDFYRTDREVGRPYRNPAGAHLAYWTDPAFFRTAVDWLEGRRRTPAGPRCERRGGRSEAKGSPTDGPGG